MSSRMNVLLALFGGAVVVTLVVDWYVTRPSPPADPEQEVSAVPTFGTRVDVSKRAPRDMRPASIRGIVLDSGDPAKKPIANARVCARRGWNAKATCVTADASGAYVLTDLRNGTYWVVGSARGYVGHGGELQLAAAEVREHAIALERGGSQMTGVVRNRAGDAIPQALVSCGGDQSHTDDTGSFTLWCRRGNGGITVEASAAGYGSASESGTVRVSIVLESEGRVTGRVVDARNGAPVAGVELGNGAISDSQGNFTASGLSPGHQSLMAVGDWHGTSEPFDVTPGAEISGVVLRVYAAAEISGRVVFKDSDEACPSGVVMLQGHFTGDLSERPTNGTASIGTHGVVRLGGLAPGHYIVEAKCGDGSWTRQPLIRIRGEDQIDFVWRVDRPLRPEQARVTLTGVVTSSGTPVADATVIIRREVLTIKAVTDANGQYQTQLAPAVYTVQVIGRGIYRDTDVVNVTREPVTTKNIAVKEGGSLRGRIIDETGAPRSNVRVSAHNHHVSRSEVTDENGGFLIEGLAIGTYNVDARSEYDRLRTHPPQLDAGKPIEIRRGEVSELHFVAVVEDATLAGIVVDDQNVPVPGVWVQRSRSVGDDGNPHPNTVSGTRNAITDAAGRFEFTMLPRGVHSLRADGGVAATNLASGTRDIRLQIRSQPPATRPADSRLSGNVTLASGDVPAVVQIHVRAMNDPAIQRTGVFAVTRGHFAFDRLPNGTYFVTASAHGTTAVMRGAMYGATPTTLVLRNLTDVTGRVVDAVTKRPVAGLRIITPLAPLPYPGSQAVTDELGRFMLTQLPTGPVPLIVAPTSDSPYQLTTITTHAPQPDLTDIGDIAVDIAHGPPTAAR